MSIQQLCFWLILFALLLCSARLAWNFFKTAKEQRPHAWRIIALIGLQSASAALLYVSLFPSMQQSTAQRLVLLSANAELSATKLSNSRVLALPEAPVFEGIERVADLASALRKYPGVASIDIVGDGLPLRDMDSARNLAVHYLPTTLPEGFIALAWSDQMSPGMRWWLSGRVNTSMPMVIELVDPAGVVVDRIQTDKHGSFKLSDTARAVGRANYHIRIVDANNKIRETLLVPLLVERAKSLRVLSLAGGPNPELKYLRRWASDAGIDLESRVELGAGMQIQTANSAISAASLRELDLLILDERAWSAMSAGNKNLVRESLNAGLGILLRITGSLSGSAASELGQLGFSVADSAITQGVRLPETQGKQLLPELSRRPVRVYSRDGIVLLQTDKAEPLAMWRAQGQGRIALWWLTDSYKLALSNASDRHAQLWSEAATTLARARLQSGITSRQQHSWVNQRSVYCGLAENARIQEPNQQLSMLIADAEGVNKGCAAFWPRQPGWHIVSSATQSKHIYVRASSEALGLKAHELREANMQLLGNRIAQTKATAIAAPGLHWPYFLAWLMLTALLWLLERAKWGYKDLQPNA
jgi:hypothetical protein